MIEHRQTLFYIKSDLLSICVNSVDEQNFTTIYRSLQECINKHFGIEECYFLLNKGKTLKPNIGTSLELTQEMFESYFGQQNLVTLPGFLSEKVEFSKFTHMVMLRKETNEPYGILFLKSTQKWLKFYKTEYFEDFVSNLSKVIIMLTKNIDIRLNENQYRKLYNMTDLFHSTMDIDLILKNVLQTIQENFPDFNVELILSNDQDRQTTINIKPFDYLSERPSAIEAFVSGKIITEKASDLNISLLNAPIKGKQAIYGILQVSAPITYEFSSTQMDFIRMLGQASGNALENAKLYHQSHRLVSDLQLITETFHRLNMRIDMDEMLLFLQKQLIKSFQPMELCFMFKEKNEFKLTEASTELFNTDEGLLYINHVSKHFEKKQDPMFIADLSRLISNDIKYKSMIAIPMVVEQSIIGFSIVLHRESYFFSFDSFKLMQSLIQHSSLAIANSVLRNQLQEMVDHDHLTKLYARGYLDRFVENSLTFDDCGMFLLIDIDNFKRVNDTYGHQVGDEILVQIGEQLNKIVGSRGICARWGGEEMAVYVPNMLNDESYTLSQRIVNVIGETTNPPVTISAGLITWDKTNRPEFQTIFLQADTALYHAKNNGKNQVCVYEESMQIV